MADLKYSENLLTKAFQQNPTFKKIFENIQNPTDFILPIICKELGLLVKDFSLNKNPGKNKSGMIEKENDKYIIYVNGNESSYRQNFTIAHEISHFLLHKDILDENLSIDRDTTFGLNPFYKSKEEKTPEEIIEYEANYLAAEILMPKKLFIDSWNSNEGSIELLISLFKCSPTAIMYRAKNLGLLSNDITLSSFMKNIFKGF